MIELVEKLNSTIRESMAERSQSVGVVSIRNPENGKVRICTISSLDCLSLSEKRAPICSFKLGHRSSTLKILKKTRTGTFQYLSSDQSNLAIRFSKSEEIRMEELKMFRFKGMLLIPDTYCGYGFKIMRIIEIKDFSVLIIELNKATKIRKNTSILQYRKRTFVN